jgi:hypothetical protein
MQFRLRAFSLHLLASISAIAVTLSIFYFGWYRWPGWYLADVLQVMIVLAGVDIAAGPMLTFVVARSSKPRRELTRDIAIIAVVQLIALGYGIVSLWNGRPVYYAFSETVLQLVQAYDISAAERADASVQYVQLMPRWYALPKWIWAPLPQDAAERDGIVRSAVSGGDDVVAMPRYYKPWQLGLPALRQELKRVSDLSYFSEADKKKLEERMRAAGLNTDQLNAIPFIGRGPPLLAVFEPTTLRMEAIIRTK